MVGHPRQIDMDMSEGATGSQPSTGSTLPWTAIPKFTPGVTSVQEYVQKLKFLAKLWPKESLDLLAPRVALLIEGTAFHRVAQLDPQKLKTKDESGVALIVKTIGGSWGQTELEERYEFFERALYGTTQKMDESNDSFLARMEHSFGELLRRKTTLEEVQAYVLLRQCNLNSEDRKRILLEHAGRLDYDDVKKSYRLIGSKFFSEVQGGKTVAKTKVYDINYTEEPDTENLEPSETFLADDGHNEETFLEELMAQQDEDAILVMEYEQAAGELLQEDQDMATAFNSYQEARKRLSERFRNRGFFPSSFSRGKGKGSSKGKGGKSGKSGKGGSSALQARILASHCRLCGAKGHWKAECPLRNSQERSSGVSQSSTAPTSFAVATVDGEETLIDSLPMELMEIPEMPTLDVPSMEEHCFTVVS